MTSGTDAQASKTPTIIALCQLKGGVGKTTTAACLGAGLAQAGQSVLLLDLSPSGNLTASFGINLKRVQRSTADLLEGTYPPTSLIRPTMIRGLNLIPAHPSLNNTLQELLHQDDRPMTGFPIMTSSSWIVRPG
jgi:chromosome partitioning protein